MRKLDKDEIVLGAFTKGMQVHVVTLSAGVYKVHIIPSEELTDSMKVLCAASNHADDMLAGLAANAMRYTK